MIPPTVPALRAHLAELEGRGELRVTDAARKVAELFRDPPADAEWRPVLRGVSRLAFGTLSPGLREQYGVRFGPAKRAAMRATLAATRVIRPLLPAKVRFIAPYQEWRLRQKGVEPPGEVAEARRRAGIRLGGP